ncbi:MAG: hypothetical protein AB1758_27505, partial [Candidatus Eremiobacterota bacterium]
AGAGRRHFLLALALKMGSRFLQVCELAGWLWLLGVEPTVPRLILVAALLAAAASVFFMMPSGLGVQEAGIAGAFVLLGLPEYLGVAVGLLRRARIVFIAVVGLCLHAMRGFLDARRTAEA